MNIKANNNTEYRLAFDTAYFWKRDGNTAKGLRGRFTSPRDAMDAMNKYNASLEQEINIPEGELGSLEKKADLLGYALKNGIEIPQKYKSVGAIKKFLQGGYNV